MFHKTILLTILTVFIVSGCFNIVEEINMKADGSGELVLTLDMSQSVNNVRSYLEAGVLEGEKLPSKSQMQYFLSDLENELASMPGLSEVDIQSNWSSFVFRFRCRFRKVEDLDNALFALAKKSSNNERQWDAKPNYRFQNGIFRRLFEYHPKPEVFQKLPASRKVLLEQAKYTAIYRFEKAIHQCSNRNFQLSPSGKAIMLQTTPADIVKGKVVPAAQVTFK